MNKARHTHKHTHDSRQIRDKAPKKGLHKDWHAWAVVILMLLSMVGYLLTMDESLVPSGASEPASPSDVGVPSE